ncbi:MAG: FG-GAP-like repeat-containing protein [candidate division KSB1 bacterium]|nr:FG-GAP-like repeat-containing protein [candidate division KSB1 bacterium]MDZ7366696.1 FG-GAP-like repeat-containing protein [candidate division KSB1 bacterium]MDZ7404709.1 FG-GAP-like repeat-containing protein [candidate division KSB1 bacterium]
MMTPTRRAIRRAISLVLVLLFTTASLAQILSVSPAQNAQNVAPNTSIAVTFNQEMLATTIKDTTFLAWGLHSGWHHGTITYDKALRRATLTPKAPFAPGEMVAVTLTGDILTSAGQPLQKFAWHFTIRVTPSSGKFPISTDYGIGSTPVALFAADFDGDRDMDFAVANRDGKSISILKNVGGTLQPRQDFPSGNTPGAIFAADFDGDKDVDLAVLSKSSAGKDVVVVFKNNGSGALLPGGEFETGGTPQALFAADLDNDGDIDIATANAAGSISILKNNGNATFQRKTDYSAGKNPVALFAADLDGDGDADVAAANKDGNQIIVFKNDGQGNFQNTANYSLTGAPTSVWAADFDGDGDLDLATTVPASDKVSILKNKNDGTFPTRTDLNTHGMIDIFAADLDGDGDVDLAAKTSNQMIAAMLNNGDATLQAPVFYKGGLESLSLVAADADGDSDLDLALLDPRNNKIIILTNRDLLHTSRPDLHFNNVYAGYNKELSFKLYNEANTSVSITNISSTNAKFSITSATAFTLASVDTAVITVRYTPGAAGKDTATVTIFPSGFEPIRLPASGAGVSPGPVIEVSPAAVSFGNTSVNKTGDLILAISNAGVLDLAISNITLGNPHFSILGGNKHVIAPNAYKLIAVRFKAPFLGAQADTLRIFSTDATNNPAKVPLSGSGASTLLPEISVQPLELRFDSVLVKTSKTLTLRVHNRGAASLAIGSITSTSSRFDLLSPTTMNLAPGDSSELMVRFSPLQLGAQTGTLTLACNDLNENPLVIRLSGVGKEIPAPALMKIFPSLGARLQTIDVGLKGKNFVAGLTSLEAGPNITVNSVRVHRPDSLTAKITIAANATTGPRDFFVINPTPGGGVSEKLAFAVNNPVPVLTKITPAVGVRLLQQNFGFKGANFLSGVTSVNAGTNITVNSIVVHRADSMTVNMTIAEQAAPVAREVTVVNADPGGGASKPLAFGINNPAPKLTSLSPGKGERNQAVEVTFKGENFLSGVTTVNVGEGITVNAVTVASATSLTAKLTISPAAASGPRNFSVNNAGPGGGVSGAQSFAVNNPSPTLSKLTPNSGQLLQTLDVGFTGANFINGASSVNVGPGITVNRVTVHRTDSLTANITIGAEAIAGQRNFSVTNGAPGGGTSGNQSFAVNKPTPVLTGISPAVGYRLQTLTVIFRGTNFIEGITSVNFGPNIILNSLKVHRADSLSANITINSNAATGARHVSVSNGSGAVSESRVFTINNPAPNLARINPASGNRLQKLNVGFKGANFIAGVSAVNAGTNLIVNQVVVHRPDSLTANITIPAEASAGLREIFVTNDGGGASEKQTFTVTNPAPSLAGINPAKGSRLQTLAVGFKGANFFSGVTTVQVGSGVTVNRVTVHGLDSLTAEITIAANAEPGPRSFAVVNAGPGGGTSASAPFIVSNPAPTLAKINPVTGNRLQTLAVGFKGANFFSGSSSVVTGPNIIINSVTVHRADSLTANITIGPNAETGPRQFAISNGEGVISEPRVFTINNPAPALTSIEPASAFRKQRLNIVFTGSNFINKSTVVNAGSGIVIHSIIVNSSTNLIANITITADAERGPRNFSVTNIAPGGGTSAERLFIITNNEPSKPRMLSPANNQMIQLTRIPQPVKFIWSQSFDNDREDTVRYALHLKGPGLDTTFAAVTDTSVSLSIMPRLKVNSEYAWDLKVSDGVVTVTWPDRATFRTSSVVTSVQEGGNLIPSEYRLEQNYPNPLRASALANAAKYAETTISYQLPKETLVTLQIFDVLGREMITLVNAPQPPGYYHVTWNGKNSAGKLVPAGVYLYRLQAGDYARVMKMMVTR